VKREVEELVTTWIRGEHSQVTMVTTGQGQNGGHCYEKWASCILHIT